MLRPTNIPWLGEIPYEWDIIKLKYSSQLKGRIGWQGLTTDEYRNEGPYLVTGTDFENGAIAWDRCQHVSEERYKLDIAIQIKENDLLITKDGTIGKVAVSKNCPDKVCLNSGVFIIRNSGKYKYNSRFMYYVLQSDELQLWFSFNDRGNSTVKHLTQDKFYNFSFAYPPLSEQQAIADYLDDRCSKIDEIIAEATASIEEYKELKQAVITEIVMKGFGHDVVYNERVKLFCPAKWNVCRIKDIAFVQRGGSPRPIEQFLTNANDGLNWIKIGDTVKGYKYIDSVGQKIIKDGLSKTRFVNSGTLLLTNSMSFGEPYILRVDGCIHDGWVALTCNELVDKEFLYYYLCSDFCKTQFKLSVTGSIVQNLNVDKIGSTYMLLPSIDEQQGIVKHLDSKVEDMSALISEKQSLIEDLQAYKKSLIYEVVTGKRRVV